MNRLFASSITFCLLVGCSPSDPQQAAAEQPNAEAQHRALYNAVKEPLDKAAAAEQKLIDSAERQKQQAEAVQ